MQPLQKQLAVQFETRGPAAALGSGTTMMIRSMPSVVWESVPAVVVPMPMVLVNHVVNSLVPERRCRRLRQDLRVAPTMAYTILVLDKRLHLGRDAAGAGAAALPRRQRRDGLRDGGGQHGREAARLHDRTTFTPDPAAADDARRGHVPGPAAGVRADGGRGAALHVVRRHAIDVGVVATNGRSADEMRQTLEAAVRAKPSSHVATRHRCRSCCSTRPAATARRSKPGSRPPHARPSNAAAVAAGGQASVRIARDGSDQRSPPQPARELRHPRRSSASASASSS